MDDLISRQVAIDMLKSMYHAAERWGAEANDDVIKARAESCMATLLKIKLKTEKLPAADAVPVVRCGECKHMTADGRCLEFADDCLRPSASDFCSKGEKN